MSDDVLMLDPDVDTDVEVYDHPDEVTAEEAEVGLLLYRAVRDLDDDDNGLGLYTASPGYSEARRRAEIVRTSLLRAGVPEVSIELQDGRPGYGDTWNLCRPVFHTSHHIASTPSVANPTPGLSLVKRGRSDLPGPLANGTAGVDLVYRILTMGMANHPGTGGPLTVSGPLGSYGIPRDVARPYAWGTEYEGGYTDEVWNQVYTNRRTGQSMSFHEFMARCNNGIVHAMWLINGHGRDPGEFGEMNLSSYAGEHSTWTSRKIDRRNYSTARGRSEMERYRGDDMPTVKEIVKATWDEKIPQMVDGAKKAPLRARAMLAQTHKRAGEARASAWAAERNAENALNVAKANRAAMKALADRLAADGDTDGAEAVRAAMGPAADPGTVTAADAPDFADPDDVEESTD